MRCTVMINGRLYWKTAKEMARDARKGKAMEKPKTKPSEVGRLALRVEGDLWVAYYAKPDSMDGALFLGSIRMAFVERRPKRKTAFMELMKAAVGDVLKEAAGAEVVWPNPAQPAPERERGGNA